MDDENMENENEKNLNDEHEEAVVDENNEVVGENAEKDKVANWDGREHPGKHVHKKKKRNADVSSSNII